MKRKLETLPTTTSAIGTTDISDVSPSFNDASHFAIRARVTWKTPLSYNNGLPSFYVHLADATGEIRCNFRNDAALQHYDVLQVNQVYLVSKAIVKDSNTKFNRLTHLFELDASVMNPCTTISKSVNLLPSVYSALPKHILNPETIVDIAQLGPTTPGQSVNVVGVVLFVGAPQFIRSKKDASTPLKKIDFVLYDKSSKPLIVSCWSDFLPLSGMTIGNFIAIEDIRCSMYQNTIQASVNYSSCCYSLDSAEPSYKTIYDELVQAFKNSPSQDTLFQLFPLLAKSLVSNSNVNNSLDPSSSPIKSVSDILSEKLGSESATEFLCKATIGGLDLKQALFYKGCPDCRRKMVDTSFGSFKCTNPKCADKQQVTLSPKCYYNLSLTLTDTSGQTLSYVRIFDQEAQSLLGGISADTIDQKIVSGDSVALEDYLQELAAMVRNKTYTFSMKAGPNTYNGNTRVQYQINKILASHT